MTTRRSVVATLFFISPASFNHIDNSRTAYLSKSHNTINGVTKSHNFIYTSMTILHSMNRLLVMIVCV